MATKPPTATVSAPPPAPRPSTPSAPPASTPAKPRVVAQPPTVGNGNIGQETRESAAARPAPPSPPTPPPTQRGTPSGDIPPPDGERTSPLRIAAIVGSALACVLVVGLIVLLVGGDDPARKPNDLGTVPRQAANDDINPKTTPAVPPVNRKATTSTVLNGTTTAGLARAVAKKLEGADFTIAEVKDNVDQTLPETIVYYADGQRRAAGVVARIIGVKQSAIQPVDRNAEVASPGARVVITVGADLIE